MAADQSKQRLSLHPRRLAGIACDVSRFEDPYNNDQMSVYVTIIILYVAYFKLYFIRSICLDCLLIPRVSVGRE
jgi:hypothetical protein